VECCWEGDAQSRIGANGAVRLKIKVGGELEE